MGAWELVVPESGTNLVTNPSFELGTTGWAASGSNAIARRADRSVFGGYSLRTEYQDNTTLATFADLTLTATAHTYTAYVFLPSNWDGGAINLAIANFASATTDTATTSTTTTGEWVRLQMTFTPDAGDLTGDIQIETASAPTAGRRLFFDAIQVEAKSYATTYMDGDQPGCSWTASEHGSQSERVEYGTGGRVRNMEDDLSLPTETMQGLGMPPINNNFSPLALSNGSQYESARYASRELTLSSSIRGSSLSNLHSVRQTLVKAFNPLVAPDDKPAPLRRLRYTGASVDKEIDVAYDAGLEFNNQEGFTDETSLRLIADDPMFYAVLGSNVDLATIDKPTMRYVAGRQDGVWDTLGPPSAPTAFTSGEMAVLVDGNYVYVGGDFTDFDGIANADRIARYSLADGTWSALGTGAGAGRVHDLAADAVGNIYAVGTFTNMGGVAAADYVARWDGSSWNAMGAPSSSTTITVIRGVATHNGDVYVTGDFTDFAGVTNADYTARWDGSSWNTLGTTALEGYDIAVRGDGQLYRAAWNSGTGKAQVQTFALGGSSWGLIGGQFDDIVRSLDIGPGNHVYAAGDFTAVGSTAGINRIARHAGGWKALGTGLDAACYVVRVNDDGDVWAGGAFGNAGDVTAVRIARYTNGAWQPVSIQPPGSPTVFAIDFRDGDVYIGFDTAGNAQTAGNTDIAYAGTARTNPVIVIEVSSGTALLHSITNEATGQTLSFDYTLQDGERLVVDTRRGSRGITSSDGSNQLSALTGGDLGAFALSPAIGEAATRTNTIIIFTSDDTGTPSYDVVAYWRDAYLSAD